jgi:hypothetical protein
MRDLSNRFVKTASSRPFRRRSAQRGPAHGLFSAGYARFAGSHAAAAALPRRRCTAMREFETCTLGRKVGRPAIFQLAVLSFRGHCSTGHRAESGK